MSAVMTSSDTALARVPLRVLVAGGGTGGHLFPGIALAEVVKAGGGEVLFVGTRRGIESRVLPQEGWPLSLITVSGIKGRGMRGLLDGLAALPRAWWQSRALLRSFRPDVVVGVGGYASGPVVATAALAGIPTAILEQNSIPGVTNRMLARMVDRVFCTFDDVSGRFPARKVVVAGNPIRKAIVERIEDARTTRSGDARPRLFVFGGSQGARAINDIMIAAVPSLIARVPGLQVWHQTGAADITRVRQAYGDAGLGQLDVRVDDFIRDMAAAYAWSDLVVCRAGATSLSELAVAGSPAILIPFPQATDNHQEWNARSLVDRGAAVLLLQSDLTCEGLTDRVSELLTDRERLAAMAGAMKSVARPHAATAILDGLLALKR